MHPDIKGKKGGVITSNDDAQLEPIYEEIPEQRSITMLPPSAIESNRSSELGMEYDDVETILLGKLSAKDLEGVVDIDPEGEEEFTPLQFEVEADVEPVREQPLYVNIQADEELSPKVKKRKSTLKHHSKRESTHHSHHHHHHRSQHKRHKEHTADEGGPRAREQGHNRISPSLTHNNQSQLTHQMGVASPARSLPPPPSFAPPPPPSLSPQRAPPNAPPLIDFTDTPLENSTPTHSKQ